RCLATSTKRSPGSRSRRWGSRSTGSPRSRSATWPRGTKAPEPVARRPAPLRAGSVLEPERILRLEDDRVVFLDQRKLPGEEVDVWGRSAAEVADAIRTMVVRGAPAIGIAAAYGIALAAARGEDLEQADVILRASRPTAVNLAWALDEMRSDPSAEHARA